MNQIVKECPHCAVKLRISESALAKEKTCPKCGEIVRFLGFEEPVLKATPVNTPPPDKRLRPIFYHPVLIAGIILAFLFFMMQISAQNKMTPEIKQLSSQPMPAADRIIGSWYFETDWSRPFRITLYRKGGKLYEQTDYSDARIKKVHEVDLDSTGEITFKPLKYLAFTRINESGNLEMHFRKDRYIEIGKPLSYYKSIFR